MADEEQETAGLTRPADRIRHRLAMRRIAGPGAADVYHWDEAVLQDDTVDYHFWSDHALDARTSTLVEIKHENPTSAEALAEMVNYWL
jgi:hypothetical protein